MNYVLLRKKCYLLWCNALKTVLHDTWIIYTSCSLLFINARAFSNLCFQFLCLACDSYFLCMHLNNKTQPTYTSVYFLRSVNTWLLLVRKYGAQVIPVCWMFASLNQIYFHFSISVYFCVYNDFCSDAKPCKPIEKHFKWWIN